jgi:hypothetical protein
MGPSLLDISPPLPIDCPTLGSGQQVASSQVLRFLWHGPMALWKWTREALWLWRYGTMALGLGRAELVSGGGKWSREAMAKC